MKRVVVIASEGHVKEVLCDGAPIEVAIIEHVEVDPSDDVTIIPQPDGSWVGARVSVCTAEVAEARVDEIYAAVAPGIQQAVAESRSDPARIASE